MSSIKLKEENELVAGHDGTGFISCSEREEGSIAMDDDAVESITRELNGYRLDLAATFLHGEKWFGEKEPGVGLALPAYGYTAWGHTA